MSSPYVLKDANPDGGVPGDSKTIFALSADEAVLGFEKELGCRLEFCEEDEVGEFVLDPPGRYLRRVS
jgi:hypothetical protein